MGVRRCPRQRWRPGNKAFSLLEVLVSTAVLVVLTYLALSFTSLTSNIWRNARAKVGMYRDARTAFDRINQELSQATLNTYWDYQLDASGVPARYKRSSDLHFICGKNLVQGASGHSVFFQTPASLSQVDDFQGLNGLLNEVGYYVAYDRLDANAPSFLTSRSGYQHQYGYILYEVLQPTEAVSVYSGGSSDPWYTKAVQGGLKRPIADNVIALIVWPRLSEADDAAGLYLSSNYEYDSQDGADRSPQPATANQLPPTVQLTMIAVDPASMARFTDPTSSSEPSVITGALSGRFQNAADYQRDIDAVSNALTQSRINFRIFNATVPIKESKWSD